MKNNKILITIIIFLLLLLSVILSFKKFTTTYDYLIPIVISLMSLGISILSAFKAEMFSSKINVIAGDVLIASPSAPSHDSLALVLPISFINIGYGDGIVEWVALKVKKEEVVKLYTPLIEIDYDLFIKGQKKLHQSNIRDNFSSFILEGKKSTKKWILFSQEENSKEYPFSKWENGKYIFEIYLKVINKKKPYICSKFEWNISQDLLNSYFSGDSTMLINKNIQLQ